jgi:quercetin dioxygenase-like cupin family protein
MIRLKHAVLALSASLAAATAFAHGEPLNAIVAPVMTKALNDYPGKEAEMITVEYPPGAQDPVHRHNAHGFIYVLEGTIIMQVKGGKEVRLTPGQSFYEGPNDVHTVGRNASKTQRAKFLVLLLKGKGAPIFIPEQGSH